MLGLPVEDFSSINTFSQPYITHASPLSASLPGLSVSTVNPGLISNALEVYGGSSGPKNVGTNWFQDTLVLNFSSAVSAVGENVFGTVYGTSNSAGTVTENVYNGATLLGSRSLGLSSGVGHSGDGGVPSVVGYLGVTSPTANITSVRLLFSPSVDIDSNTFVTNVAVVPEPSAFALAALAAVLFGLRVAANRRCAL